MLRGMTEPQNAIAETPAPPYYAVVFTSVRTEVHEGYAEMAAAMAELAARQPGYLGIESAREALASPSPTGATSRRSRPGSGWSIMWPRNGRERWYAAYRVRVARVERDYGASSQTRRRVQVSSSAG
jgi:heme-degrading monooxygenase HmoA